MKIIRKLWGIGDSSIILLIMFLTKLNLIGLIERFLPYNAQNSLKDTTLRLAINTALMFLFVEFLFSLFKHPIILEAKIDNIEGTTTTEIHSASPVVAHRSRIIYVDLSVDYRSKINKWIVSLFGGVYLHIWNTTFTTIQVDKVKTSYPVGVIDDSSSCNYIRIKIDDILGMNETDKENIRIICDISSNLQTTVGMGGSLSTSVVSKNNSFLGNLIINILVGSNNSKHKIQLIN
ncbi:hypothetical protein [Clostridium sp.]|jgi:hypothetical protein|uniref:hypothetical protein n=1 Tax=Clostridium sp. TaxID=1506 RepID=UPI003EE96411